MADVTMLVYRGQQFRKDQLPDGVTADQCQTLDDFMAGKPAKKAPAKKAAAKKKGK